jgi:hypothetical protein
MDKELFDLTKNIVEKTMLDTEKTPTESVDDFFDAFNEQTDLSTVVYTFFHSDLEVDSLADTLLDLGKRYEIKKYAVVNVDELDLTVVAVKVELVPEFMK